MRVSNKIFLVLLFTTTACTTHPAPPSPPVQSSQSPSPETLRAARRAKIRDLLDKAQALLPPDAAGSARDDRLLVIHNLALGHAGLGEFSAARTLLTATTPEERAAIYEIIAHLQFREGAASAASATLEEALALDVGKNGRPALVASVASAYAGMGNLDRARQLLLQASTAEAKSQIWCAIAAHEAAAGRKSQAQDAFANALQLFGNDADSADPTQIARAQWNAGDPQAARETLKRCLPHPDPYTWLQIAIDLGPPSPAPAPLAARREAFEELERAAASLPDDNSFKIECLAVVAANLARMGDLDAARARLPAIKDAISRQALAPEMAKAVGPEGARQTTLAESADAWSALAIAQFAANDIPDYEASLQKSLQTIRQLKPGSARATLFWTLAVRLAETGQLPDALRLATLAAGENDADVECADAAIFASTLTRTHGPDVDLAWIDALSQPTSKAAALAAAAVGLIAKPPVALSLP
jgi:hypothetical protein